MAAPDPPDEQLVAMAQAGDPAALDRLVRRHHPVAYRVALGILREEDLAADATQEGVLKALRALPGFRGESRFRTWLVAIVANEARGLLRRQGRRRESALDEGPPLASGARAVDEQVVRDDEAKRARRLLERLPEKQRMAVQLRIDEGLSYREVGEVIGSSEGAARVNFHHGIRRLREWMNEEQS